MRLTNPLELFSFLRFHSGTKNIRVFREDVFLYASFDDGREQVIHAAALSRKKLIDFWKHFDGRVVF